MLKLRRLEQYRRSSGADLPAVSPSTPLAGGPRGGRRSPPRPTRKPVSRVRKRGPSGDRDWCDTTDHAESAPGQSNGTETAEKLVRRGIADPEGTPA